jgi:hypothetical protein
LHDRERRLASLPAATSGSTRRDARSSGRAVAPRPLPVEVADADAVEDAAARVEGALGLIDVWTTTPW